MSETGSGPQVAASAITLVDIIMDTTKPTSHRRLIVRSRGMEIDDIAALLVVAVRLVTAKFG